MEKFSSLHKITETSPPAVEEAIKEKEHTVRWRGRKVIVGMGTPKWKESMEPSDEERAREEPFKSPVKLLLKMLSLAKSKSQ